MRTSVLTDYYYICANILRDYLSIIPKLQLTDAKTYYGRICVTTNSVTIRLSRWNLDCGCFWEEDDYNELIDTICHEFAHLYFWEHGKEHDETTVAMVQKVKAELKIRECKARLEILNETYKVAI